MEAKTRHCLSASSGWLTVVLEGKPLELGFFVSRVPASLCHRKAPPHPGPLRREAAGAGMLLEIPQGQEYLFCAWVAVP